MANLDSIHTWERFAPNIGDNRTRKGGPVLFLELATGLTAAQLAGVGEALKAFLKPEMILVLPMHPKSATPEQLAHLEAMKRDDFTEGVRVNWTPEQLEELKAERLTAVEEFRGRVRAVWVEALGQHVRVEGGPHTVQGQPLGSLEDYVKLVQQRADLGMAAMQELREALDSFNSFDGPDELFSRPSSGGARSTGRRSDEKAESPTDAR